MTASSTEPPVPALEPAFTVVVELGPLEDLGVTRAGHRRVVPIVGGTVDGAIVGTILAGGADWQIVQPDGTVAIDSRYTVRASNGALVLVHAAGVRSGPPEVLAALLRGEPVPPTAYSFRTAVRLECEARPDLERCLFIASCVRDAHRVRYTAYRVL